MLPARKKIPSQFDRPLNIKWIADRFTDKGEVGKALDINRVIWVICRKLGEEVDRVEQWDHFLEKSLLTKMKWTDVRT